jgi:hypothetical protein
MSLVIERKEFEIPDEGLHNATITEVKDLGTIKTAFGDKHRVMIRYRTDQHDSKGEPLTVIETFNAVLSRGSRLAGTIESLTGERPSHQFDLEELVGWTGQIVVQHTEAANGRTYANVTSTLRKKTANDDEVS